MKQATQLNKLRQDGCSLHDAIVEGSVSRLRPVVMTAWQALESRLEQAGWYVPSRPGVTA